MDYGKVRVKIEVFEVGASLGADLALVFGEDPYEPGWYWWIRVNGEATTPPQGPFATQDEADKHALT